MALSQQLSFATLNVRGLRSRQKQVQLRRLLSHGRFDFVAIQETKLESDEMTGNALQPFLTDYFVCVSHSVGLSAGCFLFLKRNLPFSDLIYNVDSQGRFISCDFQLHGVLWRLLNVYAFSDEANRVKFFETMGNMLDCDRSVVLMGDFNCVCNPSDRAQSVSRRDRSAEVLTCITDNAGLIDTWSCARSSYSYTHFQGCSHARLDRIYVSSALLNCRISCEVQPISFSDHCMVIARFGDNGRTNFKPKWKLWKLNVSLISDKEFISRVRSLLSSCFSKNLHSFAAWEMFKLEIRDIAIEISSIRSYVKKCEEKMLRKSLYNLHELESETPGTYINEITLVKSHLQKYDAERYRGARIRARTTRALHSEEPTRQALLDERRHANSKHISDIYSNGVLVTKTEEIIKEFQRYYTTLFSSAHTPNPDILAHFVSLVNPLSEDDGSVISGPFTQQEIELAIDQLPLSKTPGPDGISGEFYKAFKFILSPVLLNIFTASFDEDCLPQSFTKSHIILIPKSSEKEKLRFVECYRPITLTNVDYKIYAKVLSNRLQYAMALLIGPHQTCGLKGRSIQTNLHLVRTALQYCSSHCDHFALLQIDLAKAFDRVNHTFLFKLLEHANVGSVVYNGVRMCYTNCSTNIIVNGNLSEPVYILSSVKQGCPLSPLLFALYLEPLCISILKCSDIHGFNILGNELKVLAYADDLAFFCSDKPSIDKVLSLTEKFGMASSAQINWSKSSGLWFGLWGCTPTQYAGIEWTTVPPKYLGVPFDAYKLSAHFWRERVPALQRHADTFTPHRLSIFGRAAACNLFLATKIFYVLQILHCARTYIQRFHRIFATFVWSSTFEPMRRDNIFRPVCAGGLGLVHLYVRQIVWRFFFFRDTSHPILRSFIQVNLFNALPNLVVSSQYSERPCLWGFMYEVYFAVQFLIVRFSTEYLYAVSRKQLYKDLISMIFPPPLYRSTFSSLPGKDVLKRVRKMPLSPCTKTFFFKLHSETLPVKTWLHKKGIFVSTVNCRLCDVPETIEHCFISCKDAILFWDVLQRTLKKDFILNHHTIRYLIAPHGEDVPFDMFFLIGLHSLWKTRMLDRNAEPVVSAKFHYAQMIGHLKDMYDLTEFQPDWYHLLLRCLSLPPF